MPGNIELDDDPEVMRLGQGGGGPQPKTLQDRLRRTLAFKAFVDKETGGLTIGDLLVDEENKKSWTYWSESTSIQWLW